jgi:hypothetical protein
MLGYILLKQSHNPSFHCPLGFAISSPGMNAVACVGSASPELSSSAQGSSAQGLSAQGLSAQGSRPFGAIFWSKPISCSSVVCAIYSRCIYSIPFILILPGLYLCYVYR